MLYAQLCRAASLNDICDGLNIHQEGLKEIRGACPAQPQRPFPRQPRARRRHGRSVILAGGSKSLPGQRQERRAKGAIVRDWEVRLKYHTSKTAYPQPLRLVRAKVEVDGKEQEMEFVTNNFCWAASSVADLHRCRWQIEIFFKSLKQNL